MKQKAFVLQNKGMNRDLSISKTGESSAYENHNIRIMARDHDTLLSVTNERGNQEIIIPELPGDLVGWNVLNNHIILFLHKDATPYSGYEQIDNDDYSEIAEPSVPYEEYGEVVKPIDDTHYPGEESPDVEIIEDDVDEGNNNGGGNGGGGNSDDVTDEEEEEVEDN